MFTQIQWARQSAWGRQVEGDGSRLLNFYATQVQHPEDAKVRIPLQSCPGRRRYVRVPAADVGGRTPAKGVHGLLEVNNARFGNRLFGVAHQHYLFEVVGGAGNDVGHGYAPWSGDPVFEVPGNRRRAFTVERSEAAEEGRPVKMASDGRRVLWTSDNQLFFWDMGKQGGAGFFDTQAPEPADVSTIEGLGEQEWVGCEWLDGYFIIAARSGQFWHSQIDSAQFDQLDFASAEVSPDAIVGVEGLKRLLHVLGRRSIEVWYNAGGGDFAFERNNDITHQVGCANGATIAKTVDYICFLGSDQIVYALMGGTLERISTEGVEYDISRSDLSGARAFTHTAEGHRFYSLTLLIDGARKNWTYDFHVNLWHERSETRVLCSALWNGRTVIGRDGDEHVYDMHLDWGTNHDDGDGDDAIYREAVSPVIFANLQRFTMSSFQVDLPQRPGDAGDSVLIEWSDDAGATWKGATNRDGTSAALVIGSRRRLRRNRLGQSATGRNMRLSSSARRRIEVLGAYVETDVSEN